MAIVKYSSGSIENIVTPSEDEKKELEKALAKAEEEKENITIKSENVLPFWLRTN